MLSNKNKIYFSLENFYLFILFLVSFLINLYYANRGVFPLDSFLHFDSGYRILNNELPVRDFWIVHGIFPDYLQAIFFKIFDVNWIGYIIHPSLLNGLISIFTFYILRLLDVNKHLSFVFCIFFGILAYPPSGTPFIDHHSSFFSLLGIYFFILGIKKKKFIYYFFLPFMFGLAFLSKQVPAIYVIFAVSLLIIFFSIIRKNKNLIIYSFAGTFSFVLLLMTFFKLQDIELKSFLEQYILFPISIGSSRYDKFDPDLFGLLHHFKFILFSLLPLLYFLIFKFKKKRDFFKNDDFYICLLILSFSLCLMFHQTLTKNQTFIFFLIPFNIIFGIYFLEQTSLKKKNIIFVTLFFITLFLVTKYHLRFNENRKFHELNNIDFNNTIPAELIDKRLKSLNWISPNFKEPREEIELVKFLVKTIEDDKKNVMLITNYLFFDSIVAKKLNSPSRTYDSISFPSKDNKYYNSYREIFINKLKTKEIKSIYVFDGVRISQEQINYVAHYVSKNCFDRIEIKPEIVKLSLKNCNDLN